MGRFAGFTERVTGVGCIDAIMSGVLAARAMIKGGNYAKMVKPMQRHIESTSSFRKQLRQMNNEDFDKLVAALATPLLKNILYNSTLDFAAVLGKVLKLL